VADVAQSGERAGFDGHKKRKGSKVHIAVDTLGYLLALAVTPANEQDRAQVSQLTMSHQFRIQGEAAMKGAAGQKRVPDEFIQNFRLRLPPLEVQRRISDFLEVQFKELNTLLADKERMLSLLVERHLSSVSQVVTRGLNALLQFVQRRAFRQACPRTSQKSQHRRGHHRPRTFT
jgi:hypothetical protein